MSCKCKIGDYNTVDILKMVFFTSSKAHQIQVVDLGYGCIGKENVEKYLKPWQDILAGLHDSVFL